MLVFKFCNFLLFSPLFSFLKGLFTIVQAFYFLCREAFMLLKGRRKDIGLKLQRYRIENGWISVFLYALLGCLRWPDAVEQQRDLFGTEPSLPFLPSSLMQTGNKVRMP